MIKYYSFLFSVATVLSASICSVSSYSLPPGVTAASVTTVYNALGHGVSAFYNLTPEFTSSEISQINADMAETFPNACYVSTPTKQYNCYAYTFGITDKWLRIAPSVWLADDFTQVASGTGNPSGSQAAYFDSISVCIITYGSDHYGKYGQEGFVTSKWGQCGVYTHYFCDCPYGNSWQVYVYGTP